MNAPPPSAKRPPNTLAVISLLAGIVGYMGLPLVASIAAIVCGHLARAEIRKTGEEGDVMAIIGLVLGYSHIALVCIALTLIVAIYGGIFAFIAAQGFDP